METIREKFDKECEQKCEQKSSCRQSNKVLDQRNICYSSYLESTLTTYKQKVKGWVEEHKKKGDINWRGLVELEKILGGG